MKDAPDDAVKPITLAKPTLGPEEEAAVLRVLRSGQLVQGPEVAAFEGELCDITGRRHAVATASGTGALAIALRALGVGPGAEVLVPALTWPSPAHAVLECGATPVLVDVDPDTWNVTAQALSAARSDATAAAIVIDQFGNPAPLADIEAALPGLPLLLDAACSLGARRAGAPCGAGGVIACTSFHPRKVLTTGEGGACLTDDPALDEALRQLRNHGQRRGGGFARAAGNARMTELSAAIGRVQLTRLPTILARRRALAESYAARLAADCPGVAPQRALPDCEPNHQTFGVLLPPGANAAGRDAVVAALRAQGVQSGRLSYALQRLPQLSDAAARARERGHALHNAATIDDRGISLPLHPAMADGDPDRVVAALAAALDAPNDA